ncbi:hypothetical protein EST38_g5813 [Candolleomyces aberdarensis]|uniref:Uncharacterized protein n=1 Tax=Candolleomyces aberdarensis TaxID=2316362 RepID=A0A4Q2DLL3_9AGAR|nr:hypothetical protein EST38_g5813 [Candolleomyces aberdarensis]
MSSASGTEPSDKWRKSLDRLMDRLSLEDTSPTIPEPVTTEHSDTLHAMHFFVTFSKVTSSKLTVDGESVDCGINGCKHSGFKDEEDLAVHARTVHGKLKSVEGVHYADYRGVLKRLPTEKRWTFTLHNYVSLVGRYEVKKAKKKKKTHRD